MMLEDDFMPSKGKPTLKKLDPLSVDELKAYKLALEAEIGRVDAEMARKQAYQQAASQFFRTNGS